MSAVVEEIGRPCEGANCLRCVTLKYARYCDPCRSLARRKRKLYVSNDLIDRQIRRIYHERCEKRLSAIPTLKETAKKIGWPKWALQRRARTLGLVRTKELPWSEAELQILERFAWMSDERIRLKLKGAGFIRTATAVHVKLKRTSAKQNTPYLTARGLADLFGVDSHMIAKWIKLNYLHARRRGTERVAEQGGDMWLIHENDVYKFVPARPLEFDIRKVDQLWFLDLVTQGKIASA